MPDCDPTATLDLRGEVCPFTSVRTRLALEPLPPGARLTVLVDHEPAVRNVPRSAAEWGDRVLGVAPRGDGVWAIEIARHGEAGRPAAETARVYLDHNATTPPAPEVCQAMADALANLPGNPSSIHAEGRATRAAIEQARREVAALIGGAATGVVFTSGGTEASFLAILGLAELARAAGRPPVALAAAIDHPATAGAVAALTNRGFTAKTVPVDRDGAIDPDQVEALCRRGAGVLAVALANHELGTIQQVAAIAAAAHRHGALVFCDAVQAAGKLAVDAPALGVDALAISAHKFYGPKGVGALWVRPGLELTAPIEGGHQERGRRPGTENSAGIIGMGVAARRAAEVGLAAQPAITALRDSLEARILALPESRIHGAGAPRVGNTSNFAFAGALGEVVAGALDLAGIAVSTGAACTSGMTRPSPVLLALGLPPERAAEGVRVSLGLANTAADIDRLADALPEIVDRARRHR